MSRTPVESLWRLLNAFNGIGYTILFVFLLICLRWLLAAVANMARPRKRRKHRFVHPFPSQVESKEIDHDASVDYPDTTEQTDSAKRETALCA